MVYIDFMKYFPYFCARNKSNLNNFRISESQKDEYNNVKVHRVPILPRGKKNPYKLAINYLSFVLSASFYGLLNFISKKFDVIFGMYHDQVLTPFKALFKYNAINITLGLPFIRVSPDHGIAEDIVGKKIANPNSLIDSIKFFNNIN